MEFLITQQQPHIKGEKVSKLLTISPMVDNLNLYLVIEVRHWDSTENILK